MGGSGDSSVPMTETMPRSQSGTRSPGNAADSMLTRPGPSCQASEKDRDGIKRSGAGSVASVRDQVRRTGVRIERTSRTSAWAFGCDATIATSCFRSSPRTNLC